METVGPSVLAHSPPPAPQNTPATAKKAVGFTASAAPANPAQELKAGVAAAGASPLFGAEAQLCTNQLYESPPGAGLARQDSWRIEAQRSDRMEAPQPQQAAAVAPALSGLGALAGDVASPSLSGAYTPASGGWLESARKVDDLRGRLEALEDSLREMEGRAVAHLDRSLQEKVLATAAKIVQKRFLADKELDRKLQEQILRTAIKVVKRQGAGAGAAPAVAAPAAVASAVGEAEAANPQRRLEFALEQQQGEAGAAAASTLVQQYVAQVEQGLGQVLRRLEKKVDGVAALADAGALELLEARLAGGVAGLDARLAALEAAADVRAPPTAADGTRHLLERVAGLEAAMLEQSRAVSDLLRALGSAGSAQHLGAAVAAAQAQAGAAGLKPAAQAVAREQEAAPAAVPAVSPAEAQPAAQERQQQREQRAAPAKQPAPVLASELLQRRSAAAKRSALGDPARAGAAGEPAKGTTSARPSPRPTMPRLQATHAAGTAQQIAMATARQQLALTAQRAREEAEAEAPVWVTMVYVFGWGTLGLLGLAAVLVGMAAALVKSGRLRPEDLEFLFK